MLVLGSVFRSEGAQACVEDEIGGQAEGGGPDIGAAVGCSESTYQFLSAAEVKKASTPNHAADGFFDSSSVSFHTSGAISCSKSQGFTGTTVDQIAESAGVSLRTFYQHSRGPVASRPPVPAARLRASA
ncbi:TetR/AcrR family transcriptional regulator [Streptomyces sp. NPDC048295]|uniref:TetR/AcrR family transcriptional regulator n=1 Tax=Streptomyces sp. NPDC048295 TaxID=3154617 RepID=UPI0034268CC0